MVESVIPVWGVIAPSALGKRRNYRLSEGCICNDAA
ncbi:hypothetical protein CO2235_200088 [Cupriavidus oxalaticus]|uniref:Uncharacterized protein n=1 Tax=Cupriavidus oxalaticus TaxID=96344 RepID=A0A976BD39_9BURK|nr:hypothetical protein CO2235_200088 [Cupriavidus oxalaticus]